MGFVVLVDFLDWGLWIVGWVGGTGMIGIGTSRGITEGELGSPYCV